MLSFYPVTLGYDLPINHPLHVSQFYHLERMRWTTRKQLQGLVLSIAITWYRLVKGKRSSCGFITKEMLLTALGGKARHALDQFFDVVKVGYNFGNGDKSPTHISPKRLDDRLFNAVGELLGEVQFNPGPPPPGQYTISPVWIQPGVEAFIFNELERHDREDLIPAVKWLLEQKSPISFYFRPSGQLLARDTSVWPIRAIETWPGWLRSALFGTCVDIENAYCQFLLQRLREKYADKPHLIQLKYKYLLAGDNDKQKFREELCALLRLPINDESIGEVKHLIMSLANGSNATAMLLTNGSNRSEAVSIVHAIAPHLLPTELIEVGNRLSAIAKQFNAAKRDLCLYLLNERPTRKNVRRIFGLYFAWEREARLKIWNALGQTGLMLHDGIDGVKTELAGAELSKHIEAETGLRVSVDSYTRAA